MLTSLDKYRNEGLLFLRITLGLFFIGHGLPKMLGGKELWGKIGGAMANIGINFMPEFWGFMASFSELFGGILIILGLFFRPASILISFTLIIAMLMHIKNGDAFNVWSHAGEDLVMFLALILIGPGIYSLDEKFFKKKVTE